MSKELVPITEFPVAAALPDYLEAGRIGVDVGLIGKVAQWGCFRQDVEITAHFGDVTSYDVGVNGMAGANIATASVAGKVTVAARSKTSFSEVTPPTDGDIPILVVHHGVPKLQTSLNIAEMQQRLPNKNGALRDVKAWSKQLDGGISESLRTAARQNILGSLTSYREAFGAAVEMVGLNVLFDVLDTTNGYEINGPSNLQHAAMWAIFWNNNFRKGRRDNLLDPTHAETCYSLFPGIHLDRYAAVEGLTRTRRLIRPIK